MTPKWGTFAPPKCRGVVTSYPYECDRRDPISSKASVATLDPFDKVLAWSTPTCLTEPVKSGLLTRTVQQNAPEKSSPNFQFNDGDSMASATLGVGLPGISNRNKLRAVRTQMGKMQGECF